MERTAHFEEYAAPFSYEYDRLRFVKPVFIGDTIRSPVTIADKGTIQIGRLWAGWWRGLE